MYVSDDYKAGFVHIPKTGGTAIRVGILSELSCRRLRGKHSVVQPVPEDYFVFAFVRNPYERCTSTFRFLTRPEVPDRGKFMPSTLGSLIESSWGNNPERQALYPLCQADFISPRVIIYKFEDFDNSVLRICGRLGIASRCLVRSTNSLWFGDYDWRAYMDKRAHEIINDTCNEDFERFGYRKMSWKKLMR